MSGCKGVESWRRQEVGISFHVEMQPPDCKSMGTRLSLILLQLFEENFLLLVKQSGKADLLHVPSPDG
jgi:hypothetical protein